MKLLRKWMPVVSLTALLLLARVVPAAEAPATNTAAVAAGDQALAEATRLLYQLRAQHDANQRTIEQLKEQAAAMRHSEEVTAARLKLIEMTLAERHERELASLQTSNRQTLVLMAAVAGLGLISMIVLAVFLFRATGKLADLPALLPAAALLGEGRPPRALLAGTTSAEANERLLTMVELLAKKFADLERTLESSPGSAKPAPQAAARPASESAGSPANGAVADGLQAAEGRVHELITRGQELFNLEKTTEALVAFDEAIGLDPRNTEALVKRGKVLEKLGRVEDALRSYDRALAVDASLTIAHLGKGGVLNRMERFAEALECYERALKSQEQAAHAA